jgi:hemerythrin-like domain-containing protein
LNGGARDLALGCRHGLPDALRVLVAEFPRDGWKAHPGLDDMVRYWLERHLMFRRMTAVMRNDTQALIDREIGFEAFAPRLRRLSHLFLSDLHTHHTIEDTHFFPQLVRLDARISRGFDLLEADHSEIDQALQRFSTTAQTLLKEGDGGPMAAELDKIDAFLDRHLTDEEDLIVPLILKTGYQL